MPWLNKRWISFFVFSAAVGVVIVSVVGWANSQESIKKQTKLDSFGTNNSNGDDISPPNFGTNWTNFEFALVNFVSVNSFDPNGKTGPAFGVQIDFSPILNLTSDIDSRAPSVSIQLIVAQKTINISANTVLPEQSVSLTAFGNPNSYPFDSYSALLPITASIQSTGEGLPLTVYTQGAVQGFTTSTTFAEGSDDGSRVLVTFTIQRSNTTRLFAAIVFLLMWFLSLSIFIAAMSVWFRGKNAELPLVTISAGLLFALPNIRNSQPGVPIPVGTTEDMVGFFWNILLVSASAISLLIKWILQNKRPPPAPVVPTDPENGLKLHT